MKIAFYSVVLNHHQVFVADELYKILGNDYVFVETTNCNDSKGSTEDLSKRPYLLRSWKSKSSYDQAMNIALTADVCIFAGIESLPFEKARLSKNLLSFDMSERVLKRGLINVLSPRIMRKLVTYHLSEWNKKPLYKLCCSAFAKDDLIKLHAYKNKCFKWGYFTKVDETFKVEAFHQGVSALEITPLMWCARFLKLKHPELPIMMAQRLKSKGYKFTLDMFGSGVELDSIMKLATELHVEDVVKFCGTIPNDQVLQQMREHEIFLFTSDKNEGWGAVANEAMSNGCVIVGSDAIGSTPFLVKDGENGFLYKSCDLNSLTEKVEWLLNHPVERMDMRIKAFETMKNVWSPKNAAASLVRLIENIKHGRDNDISEGPGSGT